MRWKVAIAVAAVLILLCLAVYHAPWQPGSQASSVSSAGGSPHSRRASSSQQTTLPSPVGSIPENVLSNSQPGQTPRWTLTAETAEQFLNLAQAFRKANLDVQVYAALRSFLFQERTAQLDAILSELGYTDLAYEENASVVLIHPVDERRVGSGDYGRGFGNHYLKWLGVNLEAENRGKGVTIAILDTAVNANSLNTADGAVSTIRVDGSLPASEGEVSYHGTAVASLLKGASDSAESTQEGLVPSAQILSYPVLDGDGYGSAYQVANAIVAAADAGADILSLSLGFTSPSAMLQAAVEYAQAHGVVIVAAAGNDGESDHPQVLYPAAYEGVIAVGAVNADALRAAFSTTGAEVTLAAPGVALQATDDEGNAVSFTGTSAATPCVAGAIANQMALHDQDAITAASVILENTNDAGLPGDDPEYGVGILNVERADNYDTAGRYDAATAGVAVTVEDGRQVLLATAQNQGTEPLDSITLEATMTVTPFDGQPETRHYACTSQALLPGETFTGSIPLELPSGMTVTLETHVRASEDQSPANNRKTWHITIP
ncbi:MAG: S8 family serine peptidase [Victivallales bacterium]|nr:S8 family serine peptidase [Victivallales bacterium]